MTPETDMIETPRIEARHVCDLEPGDVWVLYKGHIIAANPTGKPFMIDLETGERRDLEITYPTHRE
jgi:hypothetical protein